MIAKAVKHFWATLGLVCLLPTQVLILEQHSRTGPKPLLLQFVHSKLVRQ